MVSSSIEAAQVPLAAQGSDEQSDPRHDDEDHDVDNDLNEEDARANGAPRRKKRRVIQNSDKKFTCPEPNCMKQYSRAEHLYRHQLNHNPKQVYHCQHPGCPRYFVRADLRTRHMERHTAKGSHLHRKDAFKTTQSVETNVSAPSSPASKHTVSASPVEAPQHYHHPAQNEYFAPQPGPQQASQSSSSDFSSQSAPHGGPVNGDARSSIDPQLSNGGPHSTFPAINGGYQASMMPPATVPERRFSYDASYSSRPLSNNGNYAPQSYDPIGPMQPMANASPQTMAASYSQTYASPSTNYRSSTSYSPLPPLPPFGFTQGYNTNPPNGGRGVIVTQPNMTSVGQDSFSNGRNDSLAAFDVMDMSTPSYQYTQTLPVFNDEYGLNRSPPLALNEEFLGYLMGSAGLAPDPIIPSPPGPESTQIPQQNYNYNYSTPLPKFETVSTPVATPAMKVENPGSPTIHGLDINMKESAVSEKKRMRLIDLIKKRFTDLEPPQDRPSGEDIMNGCVDNPKHVMSLKMQRTFLASYWAHVHQQMPILHRPTFNPETCPDLLLISMMCLGASCLERFYERELTQRCAELSSFLAYYVRWEVFKDAEFRPTAKLWTFQTMLLLELFEKMYSSRSLHERAHIHHATTLIVMRRGSSLIGRSAIESPGHINDPTRTPPGPDGSINTSGVNTPDAVWNRWITTEATRRAAFAAFIIDSTHTTLFGHNAVMAPHDLKLPLPCDEALWAATSGNEVQRVEASLAANGFKPMPFLDGLRRTLNGYKVRTNTFGRVILMAGLLNVSWQLNQRDVQINSLGVNNNALGSSMKWRSTLTRAFDHWRNDFDDSLAKNDHYQQLCNPRSSSADPDAGTPALASPETRDSVFESRTCLHSLAHMAMHVDMIECTIFAGADWTLGRPVTDGHRASTSKRMRETWAPSARARDAVFYALRFLCEVLIPEDEQQPQASATSHRPTPPQLPTFTYSARDDYLLNRPWILYFAALIVWAYGYALDGQLSPSNYTLTTRELQVADMRRYLSRVGGVKSPEDLESVRDRNSCLGLLLLLRENFKEPRWELLHDASAILSKCIDCLVPGASGGPAKTEPKS